MPRQLPELRSIRAAGAQKASTLLLDDVGYDGPPGQSGDRTIRRSASRRNREDGLLFSPLAQTTNEISHLQNLFQSRFPDGKIECLQGGRATESAFRDQASLHRWLDLATHGFFTLPEETSALGAQSIEMGGSLWRPACGAWTTRPLASRWSASTRICGIREWKAGGATVSATLDAARRSPGAGQGRRQGHQTRGWARPDPAGPSAPPLLGRFRPER